MSNELITVDILNSSIITGRSKKVFGKFLRSIDVNQTNGFSITTEPLNDLGVLLQYPQNPNNTTYPITTVSSVKGTNSINFPLDAKYDWARNYVFVADAGNSRLLSLKTSDFSFIYEIKGINLPHAIAININTGGVFVKSFSSVNRGMLHEIDVNGVIKSTFTFPDVFSYSDLSISRNTTWVNSLPLTSSICFDHVRSRVWWVSNDKSYMLDIASKRISVFDFSKYDIVKCKSVSVENSTGNAFIVSEDFEGNDFIIKMNRDNSEYIGSGWINNSLMSSSSMSSDSSIILSHSSQSFSSLSSKSTASSQSTKSTGSSRSSLSSLSSLSTYSSTSSDSSLTSSSTSSSSTPSSSTSSIILSKSSISSNSSSSSSPSSPSSLSTQSITAISFNYDRSSNNNCILIGASAGYAVLTQSGSVLSGSTNVVNGHSFNVTVTLTGGINDPVNVHFWCNNNCCNNPGLVQGYGTGTSLNGVYDDITNSFDGSQCYCTGTYFDYWTSISVS